MENFNQLKQSSHGRSTAGWRKKALLGVFAFGFCATASADLSTSPSFVSNAHLPSDVYDRCTVSKSTMESWFFGGTIEENGWVNPADSTAAVFDAANNTRCDFYKWGAQMFLWLTSETGGSDKHVFSQAPVFYDISAAEDSIGKRDFVADDGTMSLEPGAKTEIEFGEASDTDVLITQGGSVVYFGLHANNVFALYTTGINQGWFTPSDSMATQFPDSASDIKTLTKKAKDNGYSSYVPINESEALAMELKTAWVDASGWTTAKKQGYITSEAVVPVFDQSSSTGPWPIKGTAKKTIALIGMHVVGSVNGHPEMVWATFEHVNNAPANTYTYNTNNDVTPGTNTKTYDASTNDWTLMPKGGSLPTSIDATAQALPCVVGQEPTAAQIKEYQDNFLKIVKCGDTATGEKGSISSQVVSKATPPASIVKTDVARIEAWGGGTVANNTDLISLNKSVLSWLEPGDFRGNYIQTGGIWTSDGSIPTNGCQTTSQGCDTANPNLVGSLKLANTTMETYDQIVSSGGFNPINCFGCHNATGKESSPDYSISHIIKSMNSLPLPE